LELLNNDEFGLDCKKIVSNAHKHLSQFTDTLYKQLSKYIKTEDIQKRIHEVKGDKKKGKALVDLAKSTKNNDKMKAGMLLMNQSNLDESDISNINMEKIRYLKIALQ
jgi:galactokinase